MDPYELERFVQAHARSYETALAEIRAGRKRSHWMWYLFPQLTGLGFSGTARYYAIRSRAEAAAYLQHPLLGAHTLALCRALLALDCADPNAVFGSPDDLKLCSSMTLFAQVCPERPEFGQVLEKFYGGRQDPRTLRLLELLELPPPEPKE